MDQQSLTVYDDISGPNLVFLKALKYLISLDDRLLDNTYLESLNNLIKKEFNATLINKEKECCLQFDTVEDKMLFLLKFN